MVKRCSVCNHLSRSEIDRGLMQAVPYRALAGQFNLSPSALCRHSKHLARALDAQRRHQDQSQPGARRAVPLSPPHPSPLPPAGGEGEKDPASGWRGGLRNTGWKPVPLRINYGGQCPPYKAKVDGTVSPPNVSSAPKKPSIFTLYRGWGVGGIVAQASRLCGAG